MSMLPFMFWIGTIITGLVIYIGVAKAIEKSGLARLGATGKLFTCGSEDGSNNTDESERKVL